MLTKRRKEVLDFVKDYSKKKGYSPSLEEIRKRLKFASASTAHFHIAKLRDSGYLDKVKNKARAISVSNEQSLVKIPLLGTIAAGEPIEAIRNPEPIEVPRSMLGRGGNHYALKVLGTSMIDEGIFHGDIVIVREQSTVENGEKAVVYLPNKNEATLKKIYREKNRIKLVPANKTMKSFYEKNIEVQGRVVGVLRKYE